VVTQALRSGAAGLALAALLASSWGCAPLELKPFVQALEAPVQVAHRGGAGVFPEDTLVAFEGSTAMGVDVLEMDVFSTSDGVLVVHHDGDLERTTDGTGHIHDKTLAELQTLDAAYWFTTDDGATYPLRGQGITVPTLEQVLDGFPQMPMIIEAKQIEPPIVDELGDLIEAYDRVDTVALGSFDDETVAALEARLPDVALGYPTNATRCAVFQHTLQAGWGSCPGYDILMVPPESSGITVVTEALLQSADAAGIPVWVWTINTTSEMEDLLEMGVDGIMTDRPDLLAGVLEG